MKEKFIPILVSTESQGQEQNIFFLLERKVVRQEIVSCSSTGVRNTAGGVAEMVKWFSSSGMDLPNCAKVFQSLWPRFWEERGTSRKWRKVRPCNGIHWEKQENQCKKKKKKCCRKRKWNTTRNGLTQKNERNVDFWLFFIFLWYFWFLLLTVEYRIVGTTIPLFWLDRETTDRCTLPGTR